MKGKNRKVLTAKEYAFRGRIFFALAIAIMVLIFAFSSQNADDSSAISSSILDLLENGNIFFISWFVRTTGIFDIFPIRKCAHASIYFLLGLQLAGGFHCRTRGKELSAGQIFSAGKRFLSEGLIPWGCAAAYACTDELHQLFSAGRSCELRDVFIDSCGAAIGVLLLHLIYDRTAAGKDEKPFSDQ